jgi:ATP synthase protein I
MERAGFGAIVGKTVGLQFSVVAVMAAAAGLLGGTHSALSLLTGGAAVAIPNALLAWWLWARVRRTVVLTPAAMLLGEILKLGLTLAMLAILIRQWLPAIVWWALLAGIIGALKAQWLAVWATREM